MPAASSRHPSSSTAVAADATRRKLNATPAEVVLRKSIPTATVQTQTTAPVGTMAVGLRQPRLSSQPTAVPARNGHAVSATPVSVSPLGVAAPADRAEDQHADDVGERSQRATSSHR